MLRLLTGGYSNREIAATLHLTEGTVKNRVSAVLENLASETALVQRFAYRARIQRHLAAHKNGAT